jgi:predicted transcriptional regulator of viral defense system
MVIFMQKETSIQKAITIFQQHHGLLKTTEALRCGIQPRTLYIMREQKIVEQLARGLFRLASASTLSHHDIVVIAKQLPKGIICLLSALDFHGMTSHIPHQIYVAYKQNWHQPKCSYPPCKIFRFSEDSFNAGVEEHVIDGVTVKIYSPEKTVVDCFKFRNKVGIDVAIEALKLYWQKNKNSNANPNVQLIMHYAKICRIDKIIRPYLEGFII